VSFLPVLAVRNLLPCALSFSFLLDGDDAPLPGYHAVSGQLLAVHDFGLSRKVSIGLATIIVMCGEVKQCSVRCSEWMRVRSTASICALVTSKDFLLQNRGHRVAVCGRVRRGWI